MPRNAQSCLASLIVAALLAVAARPTLAQDAAAMRSEMTAKAVRFLQNEGQAEDGSFSSYAGIGPTAIVASGLLRNGVSAEEPMVAKALNYLEGYIQEDGGVYNPEGMFRNYETCLAILAFSDANGDDRYSEKIKRAEGFIKGLQWDESEDREPTDTSYGGAGYGSHERPDMSNTTFFVEALHSAGAGADDPAMKKALIFISRCQNLETEHNTTEFAAKDPDGGFYYTVAAGGESKAGETAVGGLRSYGSMTYAGLKSMIYAGVEGDDPRVEAATEWIRKHYTLDENPGMEAAGLYYYYNVLAKTMTALKTNEFVDANGRSHDWRAELVSELAKRQQDNGSWVNDGNDRWLEGDPNLVTGYVLLVLGEVGKVPNTQR